MIKKYLLEIIVFVSGAIVMIFEVAGSRLLGPYIGTSLFVWTSIIGVILGSLSLGYYFGGKLSDCQPSLSKLSFVILLAAILIAFSNVISEPFLVLLTGIIPSIKLNALVASLFLFALPSVLLGIVSPYAVRLKLDDIKHSGRTVGNLYALSTLGSIFGTFFAGFYLIPSIGTDNIFLTLAIALVLTSLIASPCRFRYLKIGAICLFLVLMYYANQTRIINTTRGLVDVDTVYGRVWIIDSKDQDGRMTRIMKTDNENSSAMYLDSDELVFAYTRFYKLVEYFKPDINKSLMLGGAAYSYPKEFLKKYPRAEMDVIEIDPGLTELAKKYFRLKDDDRLRIFHEDARTYLNNNKIKYDVIYGDAFSSLYSVPFHLTTLEAVMRINESLTDDGVVAMNIISAIEGEKGEFLRAEYQTYKKVFPHVYLFPVQYPEDGMEVQNIILIASKSNKYISVGIEEGEYKDFLNNMWRQEISSDIPVLTDDYAPVDYYINKIL